MPWRCLDHSQRSDLLWSLYAGRPNAPGGRRGRQRAPWQAPPPRCRHAPIRHRGVFVIFDPEAVKRSLDELCVEAGVEVFLHAFVGAATRDGDRITEIAFQDHGGPHRLRASSFVDASGDCDLACFAGASTRYGTHWTANLGTLATRFGGIPR